MYFCLNPETMFDVRLESELVKSFSSWFSDDPDSVQIEDVAMTMKDARLIICCISDEFIKDTTACKFFDFARESLQVKQTQ